MFLPIKLLSVWIYLITLIYVNYALFIIRFNRMVVSLHLLQLDSILIIWFIAACWERPTSQSFSLFIHSPTFIHPLFIHSQTIYSSTIFSFIHCLFTGCFFTHRLFIHSLIVYSLIDCLFTHWLFIHTFFHSQGCLFMTICSFIHCLFTDLFHSQAVYSWLFIHSFTIYSFMGFICSLTPFII